MSWLDANDAFLMEITSRDRVEDLRATADAPVEGPEPVEPAACQAGERGHWSCRRFSAARA
jgi:hypothetical protein